MIAFLRILLEHVAQRVGAGSANEEAERELAGRDRTLFLRCGEILSMRGSGSSLKQTFGVLSTLIHGINDQDDIVGSFRWHQLNGFANFALASDGTTIKVDPEGRASKVTPHSGLDRLSYKNGPFVSSGRYSIS